MTYKASRGTAKVTLLAVFVLVLLTGILVGVKKWWPSPIVESALNAALDLKKNGKAYLGWEPSRHLRLKSPGSSGPGFSNPAGMSPGVTFITGVFGNEFRARLYNMDGQVIYQWPIDFFELEPDQKRYPFDVLIHGDHLYESGDILVNLDGRGMFRVSACGEIVWKNAGRSHHSIDIADNGDIWTPVQRRKYRKRSLFDQPFKFDRLARFAPESGERLEVIELVDILILAGQHGLVARESAKLSDVFHLNDVEVLGEEMAGAFPMFNAGDLLLSSRNLSQLWVIDGQTHKLKWWLSGPSIGQHDPDFQADGTISVFDNNPSGEPAIENQFRGSRGGSRIIKIDPESRGYEVLYSSDDQNTFYSPYRGKHQLLNNGNLLITETDAGRVFEVTPDGEIVWTLINEWDENRVGFLMKATRYPEHYSMISNIVCLPSTSG